MMAETITLDLLKWEYARPARRIMMDINMQALYADDEISATFLLPRIDYAERGSEQSAFGDDMVIGTILNLSLTNPHAFIKNIVIATYENYSHSTVEWLDLQFNFLNLSLVSDYSRFGSGLKSRLELEGVNHPVGAFFSGIAYWELHSPNNQTNQIEIICEVTYYNGTAYKKLIQPFELKLNADYFILDANSVFIDLEEKAVTVMVDGTEYYTPFMIIVARGNHEISFQPTVQINSTVYEFHYVIINQSYSEETSNLSLDIQNETILHASYRVI